MERTTETLASDYIYARLTGKEPLKCTMEEARAAAEEIAAESVAPILSAIALMSRMGFSLPFEAPESFGDIPPFDGFFMEARLDYRRINRIRRCLDMLSFTLACDCAKDSELYRFGQILSDLDTMPSPDQTELDREFHRLLCSCAHNSLLSTFLSALDCILSSFLDDIRSFVHDTQKDAELLETHRAVFRAIQSKDVKSGLAAVEKHYDIVDSMMY